jgi:uncharacterized protein with PQ loop repeat
MAATWWAILAAAAGGLSWLPHGLKILRHRDGDGLSPTAMALNAITALWWTWIAVACGASAAVLASGCGTITALVYVLVSGRRKASAASPLLVGGIAALPVLAILAPALVPVLATAGSAAQVLPQAWCTRRHGAGRAVSAAGWALQGTSALLWLAYALAEGHPVLGAPALVTAPAAAIIVWTAIRPNTPALPLPAPVTPALRLTLVATTTVAARPAALSVPAGISGPAVTPWPDLSLAA